MALPRERASVASPRNLVAGNPKAELGEATGLLALQSKKETNDFRRSNRNFQERVHSAEISDTNAE
jgi:hypothetical protein